MENIEKLGSLKTGKGIFGVQLSSDGTKAYISTSNGMIEYTKDLVILDIVVSS